MIYIYYLKFTDLAMKTIPLSKRLFNEHYVLSFKNKFFVLTSKPVPGLKNTYIHIPNIENQFKPQYVAENAHTFDAKYQIFQFTAKGVAYLAEHQEKFQPVIEALKQVPQ